MKICDDKQKKEDLLMYQKQKLTEKEKQTDLSGTCKKSFFNLKTIF